MAAGSGDFGIPIREKDLELVAGDFGRSILGSVTITMKNGHAHLSGALCSCHDLGDRIGAARFRGGR